MSLRPLQGSLANWKPSARGTSDPLHAISAVWPTIVGLDVASNSAPLSLARETLTIATRSSAWSQQLQFLSLSIIAGIGEHAPGIAVTKLVFRAGAFRAAQRQTTREPGKARARRRGEAATYEPAASLTDALERVRARICAARRASDVHCPDCGAPLAAGSEPHACAACAIASARERTIELERLLFGAPWLAALEVREHLPRVTVAMYERVRRKLLARWWLSLERARTERKSSDTSRLRSIASSYVILQSRVPPDRITPSVVANALGPDITKMLYGDR